MNIYKLTTVCLMVIVSACTAGGSGNRAVNLKPVWGSQFCGMQSVAGLQLLTSVTAFDKWPGSIGSVNSSRPTVNAEFFSHHDMLVIQMGQQPNGGYRLSLLKKQARISGHHLMISVRWQTPAPDTMQAQVITNPCLLLSIPRDNNFNSISVYDQNNKKRFTLKIGSE